MKNKLHLKKKWYDFNLANKRYKQYTIFLAFLFAFLYSASGASAQNISLNLKNAKTIEVMNEITRQSKMTFAYSPEVVNLERRVSIEVKNANLNQVLSRLFSGTETAYRVENNNILLSPGERKPVAATTINSVTGGVIDSDKKEIVGASVMIKGTTTGTTTDANGAFRLNVPSNGVLIVSYLGYNSEAVSIGNRSSVVVTLTESAKEMNELVVVGYGEQKRATITGSVSTIRSQELTVAPVASTSNALGGRLSGLITKQQSGLPGADGSTLSIRGFDSAPLVIIDGVDGHLDKIDPNEIESITILKDGSAAIYGARGGQGVLLVTTKRGNIGKPVITVNGSMSLQGPTNLMKMTTAGQYAEMIREQHLQFGKPEATSRFSQEDIRKYYDGTDPNYPSTDWVSYLTRKYAPLQQHNVSLRGGSENIRYYGFFGYMNQESIIKRGGGDYSRYNLRSNIDAKVLKNLTMSVDFSTIIEARKFPWRGDEGDNSIWQDMWNTEPIYAATLPDPTKIAFANGGGTGGAHITSNRNLSGGRDINDQAIKANGSLKYDFISIPGLSAKGMISYDKSFNKGKYFMTVPDTYKYDYTTEIYTKQAAGINTVLYQNAADASILTGQLSLNYNHTFAKDHEVSGLVLLEMIDYYNDGIGGSVTHFETNLLPYLFAGGLKDRNFYGNTSEDGRKSWVSRFNYAYKSKYLVEGVFRYDAEARFKPSERWGFFPGFSLGWRASEESFIKDNIKQISNLKLRLSYGQVANDQTVNFDYLAGYKYGGSYMIGSDATQGLQSTAIANPLLTWETMTFYNVGLDFGLFQNKLYGELDVFSRSREGMRTTRVGSISPTFGASLPDENLNSQQTRGLDFKLGYNDSFGDFKYNVSGTFTWSRTKWLHYEEPEYTDPDEERLFKKTGQWVDRTIGYKSNGLFTSQEQIDQLPYDYSEGVGNIGVKPGDLIILDVHQDGLLDWRDQTEIGKGHMPRMFFGLNLNAEYKGFDLSALFQGAAQFSHQVKLMQHGVFPEIMYKERWTEANNNPKALVPRLGSSSAYNTLPSDYTIVNGDYLRMKSLAVGYTFPKKWLSFAKIENCRVHVSGTNLFTISKLQKYSIDPEAADNMGGYYYPQTRTFSMGITLTM